MEWVSVTTLRAALFIQNWLQVNRNLKILVPRSQRLKLQGFDQGWAGCLGAQGPRLPSLCFKETIHAAFTQPRAALPPPRTLLGPVDTILMLK